MQVKIYIKKKIHQDYLNYLFEFDKNTGNFIVDRTKDFGKMITARVLYKSTPVKQHKDEQTSFSVDENWFKFDLPKSRPFSSAPNYYLYLMMEDQHKLNDALEALFNIDFDRYYLNGRKLRMQQKDIIQSFILSRKLVRSIGDNETLKKRQYRDEVEMQKKYMKMLNQAAINRHERIENSLRNHNQLI